MATFKVWEALNGEEEFAREIDAWDAGAAAEEYADRDRDGLIDGCYDYGCRILVRDISGVLHSFDVFVEAVPEFTAFVPCDPPPRPTRRPTNESEEA
jgi:hypothetical protein